MSSSAEPQERRARSIALPIFALVIASVLVATAVSFLVTFSGPPPFEPPRSLRAIATQLRGLPPPSFPRDPRHHGAPPFDPHPLRTTVQAAPPAPQDGERADPEVQRRVAAELDVDPADVVALTQSSPRGPRDAVWGSYSIGWRTGGQWRVVSSGPRPFLTRWHLVTLASMLAAILALSLPAWLIARAIAHPLRQLARAADQAGTGAALPPLPAGSREVRDLSRAVRTMHGRLASHAEGRTAMLAGIAHDLGTPLSRLAFRAELLPEEHRVRAAADIAEMRAMIGATLAFARDDAGRQPSTRLDLGSLLDSLVEDMAEGGMPVTLAPGERAVMRGDPGALRRLFANLVENAVRYGTSASIGWSTGAAQVEVWVDDAGPGIDPAQAERLFQPFVRGDPSRNRATGGTGLGLAIVRSIATAHGASVTLGNREIGGARARVVLPLSG